MHFLRNKSLVVMLTAVLCLLASVLTGCGDNVTSENMLSHISVDEDAHDNHNSADDESDNFDSDDNHNTISDRSEDSDPGRSDKTEGELLELTIETKIAQMTVEEKVAQLFIISPEQLTGVDTVTAAGATTESCLEKYPVGGLIYFRQNLVDSSQTRQMLETTMKYSEKISGIPIFLSVDEEGGSVTRIAGKNGFPIANVGDMCYVPDKEKAYDIGVTLGSYLTDLGFNVDFAPVADVLSNSENTVVKYRSFGTDANDVREKVAAELEGMSSTGILSCVKHFPGHGGTSGDTHEGYAYINDTLDELYEADLIPFIQAIEDDVPFIMVGHFSVPNVVGDNTPASMSYTIMTKLLREELGYENIIITDAMNMSAITDSYGTATASVKSFLAGADMILFPANFKESYNGILNAVNSGTITEERLDDSIRRILKVKASIGEIMVE